MKNLDERLIVLQRVKWNEMFDSEEELIESLKSVDVEKFIANRFKGYEYVRSFKNQLDNGRELSPKQITQLKRISKEIYRYIKKFQGEK